MQFSHDNAKDRRFSVYHSYMSILSFSLALLEDIFRTPRIHTDFGYHRRDQLEGQRKRSRTLSGEYSNPNNLHDDVDDEEVAAKEQLEKLLAEKEVIDNEIKEVMGILHDFQSRREEERRREEENRRREEEERIRLQEKLEALRILLEKQEEEDRKQEEEDRKKELRRQRGTGVTCVLDESDYFMKNFTPYTSAVAVGDNGGWICLDDNGGWAYRGIYDNLLKKLKTRASSHPSPDYVALGSNGRYYIRFTNGKSEWVGPGDLSDLLKRDHRKVASVAFGQDWEDYFVVFEDGGFQCTGVPYGLVEKLKARGNRGDLKKVTLGPDGEWSLWAKNGRAWWGGIDTDTLNEISNIEKSGNNITDLKFGGDGRYFIRYS